jgi:hypothetical protein
VNKVVKINNMKNAEGLFVMFYVQRCSVLPMSMSVGGERICESQLPTDNSYLVNGFKSEISFVGCKKKLHLN